MYCTSVEAQIKEIAINGPKGMVCIICAKNCIYATVLSNVVAVTKLIQFGHFVKQALFGKKGISRKLCQVKAKRM